MKAENEAILGLSGLLALLVPVTFYTTETPLLAGLFSLASLGIYRYCDRKMAMSSLTDLDELKSLYVQKGIEAIILLTAVASPVVDKNVAVSVLLLVFVSETIREEAEAVSKTVLTSYAGFEIRAAVLGIGMVFQSVASYSLFYALVLVGVLTVYELGRTTHISLENI
ncbi:hypothetical protein GKQ38_02780 [Candidatus Nanohaloarchaea archaeon]|nr:hypothetical protein GKQ38_02780 [Candidatus Nanohaloarchaea archaeon]